MNWFLTLLYQEGLFICITDIHDNVVFPYNRFTLWSLFDRNNYCHYCVSNTLFTNDLELLKVNFSHSSLTLTLSMTLSLAMTLHNDLGNDICSTIVLAPMVMSLLTSHGWRISILLALRVMRTVPGGISGMPTLKLTSTGVPFISVFMLVRKINTDFSKRYILQGVPIWSHNLKI